jgi:hypothetical protein
MWTAGGIKMPFQSYASIAKNRRNCDMDVKEDGADRKRSTSTKVLIMFSQCSFDGLLAEVSSTSVRGLKRQNIYSLSHKAWAVY